MRKGRNAAREETSSLNSLPIPEIITSILPFSTAHYRRILLVPPNGRANERRTCLRDTQKSRKRLMTRAVNPTGAAGVKEHHRRLVRDGTATRGFPLPLACSFARIAISLWFPLSPYSNFRLVSAEFTTDDESSRGTCWDRQFIIRRLDTRPTMRNRVRSRAIILR